MFWAGSARAINLYSKVIVLNLESLFDLSYVEKKFEMKPETGVQKMKKYKCLVCGYVYDPAVGDPDNGVAAGTVFEGLQEVVACSEWDVGKDEFELV